MKNILLLAMSTLPNRLNGSIKISKWYEGENYMEGYSQLEPIPKMLIKKLKEQGECLDRIIILATKDAKEDIKEAYYLQEKKDEQLTLSACDLFKKRIKEFDEDVNITDDIFEIIDIDEDKPGAGIFEAVKMIRNERNDDGKIRLYIDTHGGVRGVQFVVQAIVNLLKIEELEPEGVYTVEYQNYKGKIKEDHNAIGIFDFVSGVDEFINYGRSKGLEQYIRNNNISDNGLVGIIKKISEGIQLCDLQVFHEALSEMSDWMNENEKIASLNHYIKIFVQNIKLAYGDLLKKDENGKLTATAIDKISWCLENDFIQQAITLVESQVPQDLFDKGVLSWEPDKIIPIYKNDGSFFEKTIGALVEDAKNQKNRGWETDANFLLYRFWNTLLKKSNGKLLRSEMRERLMEADSLNLINAETLVKQLPVELEFNIFNEKRKNGTTVEGEKKKVEVIKKEVEVVHVELESQEKKELLIQFIASYMWLKEQRNSINHAVVESETRDSSKKKARFSIQEMKRCIELFVELARQLY